MTLVPFRDLSFAIWRRRLGRVLVTVNDVERFHGTATDFPLALFNQMLDCFFRLALSSFILSFRGDLTRDYRYIGQDRMPLINITIWGHREVP